MSEFDPYLTVLGLDRKATKEEIKRAYRSLAKKWHPDRYANQPQLLAEAEVKIQQINQAYDKLKNYTAHEADTANNRPSTVSNGRGRANVKTHVSNGAPDSAKIHYQRGIEFAEKEDYELAISEFTQAIKLSSDFINAYQYRGYILSKLGYELRAEADFHRVESLKLAQKLGQTVPKSQTSSSYRSQTTKKYARKYKRYQKSQPDFIDFLEQYWFLILLVFLGILLAAV